MSNYLHVLKHLYILIYIVVLVYTLILQMIMLVTPVPLNQTEYDVIHTIMMLLAKNYAGFTDIKENQLKSRKKLSFIQRNC